MGVVLLKRKLTSFQIIILGFSGVILFGTFLFNNTTPITAILLYTPLCALNYKSKGVKKVKENAHLY